METLLNLLSLLGALALFLYGMKIMSEGLEKFAGNKLRAILAAMTRNRLMGVLTGILVTALIQSTASKAQIQNMLTQISELESVDDSCYKLGRTLNRKLKHNAEPYTPDQHQHILTMLRLGDQAMAEMINIVSQEEDSAIDLTHAQELEGSINNYRKQLKGKNFVDVDAGSYSYQLGVYYMDFISECEKLGDYLMNVDQAGLGKNNDYEDKPLKR